jgi:acetyl-CoA C-acetyltransferase
MGNCGDMVAAKYGFTRADQDAFAAESYKRAQAAQKEGRFKEEIVPVTVKDRKGELLVDEDEEPKRIQFDKMATLRAAFSKDGTVTAANASTLNDGAAALLVAGDDVAKSRGYQRLARIVADASAAVEPKWFTIAPVHALKKLYEKTKTKPLDWDLYEINEAFSGVTMAAMKDHGIPHERVNVHGGAVAIGHPIGCSGARVLVTLIYALRQRNLKRGIATLCIGGGEAVALGVELV